MAGSENLAGFYRLENLFEGTAITVSSFTLPVILICVWSLFWH
jgi:hypothetical protein